jgi:hypothetical protein
MYLMLMLCSQHSLFELIQSHSIDYLCLGIQAIAGAKAAYPTVQFECFDAILDKQQLVQVAAGESPSTSSI